MDDEVLLKLIQKWTNGIPLLILGSGASVPFGIPSMFELGEYLKNTISFSDSEDIKLFERFKTEFDRSGNLESTLLTLQLNDRITHEIVCKTWTLVNERDLQLYENMLQEKVVIPLSDLIRHLIRTAQKKISIITTNYDRVAEYASYLADAYVCNGFAQGVYGHFSMETLNNNYSTLQGYSGQVNIWKVHGSLDWFKTKNDVDFSIPLRKTVPNEYTPAIVTPGIEKYAKTHLEPYRAIFAKADEEIKKATAFLCIGYGFNDNHVHPILLEEIKRGKPIIVITKELTNNTKKAIIDDQCKQYVLIEQSSPSDSRIYSSLFEGEKIIPNEEIWQLNKYLTLIQ
jgi:hypothetical protein